MGVATQNLLAGIQFHEALMERDAEVRRRERNLTLEDVACRLEGFQVDPHVIAHIRSLIKEES